MKHKHWLGLSALLVAVWGWSLLPAYAGSHCEPSTRYVVLEGGLVRDTLTRLVWQQQASSTAMTYADAQTYCSSSGLRVPTLKELFSIVDRRLTPTPAIDGAAFPNTPSTTFWTSTIYQPSAANSMWVVLFANGGNGTQQRTTSNYVRCVR
jgi:hypothetical protein